MNTVIVTGGSGFVGSRVVAALLDQGYAVRATIRNNSRTEGVLSMMKAAGVQHTELLSFHVTDLERDEGWAEAVNGCDFVIHVASPFPAKAPENEDDLIGPAREGTLRVLRFARQAGAKRVVMTSSFAAIGYGHPNRDRIFTEADWTNLAAPLPAYIKSKTIAEHAAWDFVHREGQGLELTVINPTGIFGPVLGPDFSSSVGIIQRMLEGKLARCPRLSFGVVDVRDVADIHLRAMTNPAAAGERFIAVAGAPLSMLDVAKTIRSALGTAALKVPEQEFPDWLLRLAAFFKSDARQVVPDLGKVRASSNAKAKQILGWSPRSGQEAVIASAQSLLRFAGR